MEYVNLEDQIVKDFSEYSRYVNEERAIPDLYDGQKPVARRILYTMREMKLTSDKPTKKCATIVGRVMAYHPHGDSSIYGALARLAQPFSLRTPLIHGQGNFGSEEMPPAAQRYTEARLTKLGETLTQKLNKKIIPMVPNYDGTEVEPAYLYAPVPILLNTGALGIGVGMATSIPSHNLTEIIDATVAMIRNPEIDVAGILTHLKGPDFPSGCSVVNQPDFHEIYSKGKGSFVLRARFEFQGNTVVIKDLPQYSIAAKIETQIHEAKLSGGFRSVLTVINTTAKSQELTLRLRSRFDADEIVEQLCRNTDAERTFHLDLRALDQGVPKHFGIQKFFSKWLETHYMLVRKEKEMDLAELNAKLEILRGLRKALMKIDEIITTIKASENRSAARQNLIDMDFTENQANAILDIKLARLTKLEAVELDKQIKDIMVEASRLETLLADKDRMDTYIVDQLETYKSFDNARKSKIENSRYPKAIKVVQDHFYLTAVKDVVRVTDVEPKGKHLVGRTKEPIFLLSGPDIIPVKNSKEPVFSKVDAILGSDDVFHFSVDGRVKKTELSEIKSTRKAKVTSQEEVHTILQGQGYALMTMKSGKQIQFDLADVPASKRGAKGVIAVKLGGEEIDKVELINQPKDKVQTGRNKKIK